MTTHDTASPATKFALRDPETFFAAQKRNRRATWRMSALGVAAALLMGIPLTLVLTPLIYGGALLTADIINYFSPLPPEFWTNANAFARLGVRVVDHFLNQRGTLDPQQMALGLAFVIGFFYFSRWVRLEAVSWMLTNILPYFVFAIIVIFQHEIRRALGHLSHWRREDGCRYRERGFSRCV